MPQLLKHVGAVLQGVEEGVVVLAAAQFYLALTPGLGIVVVRPDHGQLHAQSCHLGFIYLTVVLLVQICLHSVQFLGGTLIVALSEVVFVVFPMESEVAVDIFQIVGPAPRQFVEKLFPPL